MVTGFAAAVANWSSRPRTLVSPVVRLVTRGVAAVMTVEAAVTGAVMIAVAAAGDVIVVGGDAVAEIMSLSMTTPKMIAVDAG
mmetsp:Transcript_73205/g.89845  ORF Transcript_73205/g.89845 Transcript_73205/m.89845 type:complete len:83 (-) Transcript_73205:151-399(-)